MFRVILASAVALGCLVGPALADGASLRDLAVAPSAPLAAASPLTANLEAWFDRRDPVYAVGEAVALTVRSNQDGYLSAFSIGPTGDVVQIYPNAYHTDNFVRAGEAVALPGAGARAIVNGPVGAERIRVVLTNSSSPVCAPSHMAAAGPFRQLIGGTATLHRDLSVVAAAAPAGAVATIERTFRSVDTRYGAGAPAMVIVFGEPVGAPAYAGYPLPQY